MFFAILFFITKSINTQEDNELPIPVSVSIEAMKTNLDLKTNCKTEIECAGDDLYNPKCGKICSSTTSGTDYLEYSFKGVKFEIYGSIKQNCNFEVVLDGASPAPIDLSQQTQTDYAKLYTSGDLSYAEHTIKIQGIQGQTFEIHKIAFYPSLQAVRINVSHLFTGKSWTEISDQIGGISSYSNAEGAYKKAVIECSKVWVYGSKDSTLGRLQITFGNEAPKEITEMSGQNEAMALIYESNDVTFDKYELSMNRIQNRILIHCIYYLSDGPVKTPEPPIEYNPDSEDAYIDKNLHELPNKRIIVNTDSAVKQIARTTFTDIGGDFDYFIRIDKEISFIDNTIKYTNSDTAYPSVIHGNYKGNLVIQNCHFINARCLKEIGIKGNILFSDTQLNARFDTCEFIDCGDEIDEQLILQYDPSSSLQLSGCTFQFTDSHKSCKVLYSTSSNVYIDYCTFDKCGIEAISMTCRSKNGDFTFTNNNIQNVIEQFILINNLKSHITFSGNLFHDISIEGGYFITINHNEEEIELLNNTFNNIASGNGTVYGGGLSLWFAREERKKYSLIFTDCKFYNITNNNSLEPYNQGGAIQYGYSSSISNVAMTFHNCTFIKNRCSQSRSSGGAIGLNINHNLIVSDCIFEENRASRSGGCIYLSGEIVDPITGEKKEGEMEKIVITNCQFNNNIASAGSAFYTYTFGIPHVKVFVESCSFVDNGKILNSFPFSSECNNVNFLNTTFKYIDTSIDRGFFSFNQIRNANVTNCTFINGCASDGCIKFNQQDDFSSTYIQQCIFKNCYYPNNYLINLKGHCYIDSSTFYFDDTTKSCGAINFGDLDFSLTNSAFYNVKGDYTIKFDQKNIFQTNAATVSNCIFENSNEISIKVRTNSFTFSHNTLKNMKRSSQSNNLCSLEAFDEKNSFTLENITFIDNKCDSLYGGGIGLWIKNYKEVKFIKCKFINNEAIKSNTKRKDPIGDKEYFNGDGGGFQFGYSEEIYKVNLVFSECTFTNNKAARHGGAIALQTVGTIDINKCTFEDNIGDYKSSSSSELLDYNNYFSWKKEGRGGAIYLNPAFQHHDSDPSLFMQRVSITGCTFTNNYAFDAHAIYIEGDDPGTVFDIKDNKFINNYNKNNLVNGKAIIMTEIQRVFDSNVKDVNTFNDDSKKQIYNVLNVSHYGYLPTDPPSTEPPITDDPNEEDELEIYNITANRKNEFIITDFSRTLILVLVSRFTNITSTNHGGAIHIQNAGLICNNTLFYNCSTSNGAGGAIYLINKYNNSNVVTLIQDNVYQCEAKYGGGFYIYSNNWKNRVIVKQCTFTENVVHADEIEGTKYGGSAIYVSSRKGKIKQNTFINCTGPGNVLMMNNNFNEEDAKSSLKMLDEEPFTISNCNFELSENSHNAVFYVKGKRGNLVVLSDCTFKGNLAKGSYYIDGISISDDSPKMIVKNCLLLSEESNSLLSNSDALTKQNDDAFDFVNSRNRVDSKKKATIAIAISSTITSIILFGAIILIVIKKKSNYQTDDETPL